jgi:2-polyprenyl-3-methyl-5-hydroxy-6-metoxy-1,4-benzoquinol methylase
VKVVPALDDFCIVFERAVLNELPEDCKMTELPRVINSRGLKLGVAEGVYVHRYGDVYESGREDLLEHVPSDADNILDVGCAKGRFGELLKKRQKCTVTGIDTDAELLSVAQGRIDKVIHGDIESAIGDGLPELYDCIVCGDLVEHLNDPWKVMKGLRNCLREKGLLIASTPNVANWAILYEMMRGRWDYVPFSILSGTHIRFFTRKTLVELFENAGYKVRKVILQSFEIPPGGVQFISGLKGMREIPEEELRASEIVVVAER